MSELSLDEPVIDVPITAETITASGCSELITAIVAQAISDHTHAFVSSVRIEAVIEVLKEKEIAKVLSYAMERKKYLALIRDIQVAISKEKDIIEETERFFLSQEFEMYSTMEGKDLIEILKKHERQLAQDIMKGAKKRIRMKNNA